MNVIDLKAYRALKAQSDQEQAYRQRLLQMSKPELLHELLMYHEAYQRNPGDMSATIRGQHLMDVLEARAELTELQDLSREFRAKLKARLYQQIQNYKS
jgi:hypothetical protein